MVRAPMKTPPTPWLRIGESQWYGNWYVDFMLYEAFFHATIGSVRDGVYIETGGSNGVHASNS